MALPVAAGLAATLVPAAAPGALAGLLAWPGLPRAVTLSLTTGLASTALALALTLLILAALRGTPAFRLLVRLLSPLLSVPHAAAALGLAFLIAPSGWIARALSPWATGWSQPPDLMILNDPAGIALILGLTAKELPFLLLMALSALPQTDAANRITLAQTLGYGRTAAFALTVLPALYRQLRLPVYAVLAYGMTSVEMGLILGPDLPPPLAVQVADWMTEASLTRQGTAAAGAALQLLLVLAALALWRGLEAATRAALVRAATAGLRLPALDAPARALALTLAALLAGALLAGLAGLALWSFAGLWSFPDALPETLSLSTWTRAAASLAQATGQTLFLALSSAALALALTIACLEAEHRFRLRPAAPALWLLWLPLIVPQITFLPGLHRLALTLGLPPFPATFAAHLVFVLPYAFLSLAPAWRAFDPRFIPLAASLGATPTRALWALRLPILLRPLLTAFAVAFAVSVGQYLATLLLSGGRIATLTTEAVALSSGGNRRLIGAYALLQMALPALAFALALALPALLFRNRKGMAA
ncbi:ABC transporter permease [Rhodobacter sp. Har01]|uniref:ABC transporter permease n=1 Tax=Rhodobacter sp. Har01 TaxID=2883999 RepID=UPI001D072C29|nr:ABC transporter permease [Rhodobacter sp. Har01]MCB6177513.1 ABC transporter permease [Rhodobacter sp. Har01]